MIHECYEKKQAGLLIEPEAASVNNPDPDSSIEMDYLQRSRSRGRAVDSGGDDIAWFLARGGVIADGDVLISQLGGCSERRCL